MTPLLEFISVDKTYPIHRERSLALRLLRVGGKAPKQVHAVRDLSFSLSAGEALGFMGPNGSGKTTVLRLAAGVTHPTSGRVMRNGRVAAVLGAAVALHPELSGLENLLLNGALHGMALKEVRARLDEILAFAGLGDFIHAPVQTYSSGMCARLGFSLSIHTDFDIAIIDEALEAGDAEFKEKILERLASLLDAGRALVFATHTPGLAARLGARTILLESGRVTKNGVSS